MKVECFDMVVKVSEPAHSRTKSESIHSTSRFVVTLWTPHFVVLGYRDAWGHNVY